MEEVEELLGKLGIEYHAVKHAAVYTVAQSNKELADKRPVKNLLLQDNKKRRTFLVIMDGNKQLDMKNLALKLDVKKLRFASPEVLMEKFGVTPGAVSLFGLLSEDAKDVEVVVDKSLTSGPEVGFHPNNNTITVFIPSDSIDKILRFTGYEYQLLDL